MLMLFQIAERNLSLYCYQKKGRDSFASLMVNTKKAIGDEKTYFYNSIGQRWSREMHF